MKTLLLVRPKAQSEAFLAECKENLGKDLPAVISPIMRIEPVGDLPDLLKYRTLVVTSRNAVDRLPLGNGQRLVTVGVRTAALAKEKGFDAICLGETAEAFLTRADEVLAPAIYLSGAHMRCDLATRLTELGINTAHQVIYDQQEQLLTDDAKHLLASGGAVILVFSPRSAKLLSSYQAHGTTRVLAISEATADAWSGEGQIEVAERPDAASMIALVKAAF